jgi:hypothetical protein
LYFNFFSDSCITFLSDGIATSISKQMLSFMFLIIMSALFTRTSLSVCTPWFHSTVISSCWHTGLGMWEYQFSVVSMSNVLHIELCKCAQTLSCLITCSLLLLLLLLSSSSSSSSYSLIGIMFYLPVLELTRICCNSLLVWRITFR